MRPLAEQSALVTGAGRGIGKSLALRLAAEGANVTVTARSANQVAEVAALASGKYDGIAGRYLDIAWDLDRPVI
jgi:NAD(P)-dependent dehydrogenase (short-subunit alcohol dehydrogenase family)